VNRDEYEQVIRDDQPSQNGTATEHDLPFRVFTTKQLMELPPPSYVIEPFLVADAINLLFGASSTYKSFVAVDWACSIATGRTWHGHSVTKGSVLYIASEGSRGIPKRVAAWADACGVPVPDLTWIPDTVALGDQKVADALLRFIDQMPAKPVLIIVETLSRSLNGGNENSSEDMGRLVVGLDRVKAATGAAILMVHHIGWEATGRERGWSGFRNAIDVSIQAERLAPLHTRLVCRKAKDMAEFDDVYVRLEPWQESLVVSLDADPTKTRQTSTRAAIVQYVKDNAGATRRALRDNIAGGKDAIDATADELVSEGILRTELGPRKALKHYAVTTVAESSATVGHGRHGQPESTVAPWRRSKTATVATVETTVADGSATVPAGDPEDGGF
jgi:hypothetical protein